MIISWYGQACVRLQSKESSLVFDPYNSSIGITLPKLQANIVCVTHDHEDHNNVQGVNGDPFIIDSPGEYEIGGVFVYGMESFHDAKEGKDRGRNIIYGVEFDGIHITHLGDLGTTELTKEQLEQVEGTDILLIPVGGVYTIDGKEAAKVAQQIEPRIIIPIHYKIPKLKYKLDDANTFLKAIGFSNGKPQDQLKITARDLPQDDTETIILSPKV